MLKNISIRINAVAATCLFMLFCASSYSFAEEAPKPAPLLFARETDLPYSFDEVWAAVHALSSTEFLPLIQDKSKTELRFNIVENKDSGFLALYVARGPKNFMDLFTAHTFLLVQLEPQKTRVYYNYTRYELLRLPQAPFESQRGRQWGQITYGYSLGESQDIFRKIEARLKKNQEEHGPVE